MTLPHYFSFIAIMRYFYICPLDEIVSLMIDMTHMQQGRFGAEISLYEGHLKSS